MKNYKKIGILCMIVISFVGFVFLGISVYRRVSINNKYSEENIQVEVKRIRKKLIDTRSKLNNRVQSLEKEIAPTKQNIAKKMSEKIKTKPNSKQFKTYTEEINKLNESIKEKEYEIKVIENYMITKLCSNENILKEVCDLEKEIDKYESDTIKQIKNKELSENLSYIIYSVIIIIVGILVGGSLIIYDKKKN